MGLICLFGAAITGSTQSNVNTRFGFCWFSMGNAMLLFPYGYLLFILGRKFYPIPYPLRRISLYFGLMLIFYFMSMQWSFGMALDSVYLIVFFAITYFLEKPKKRVISNPQLFD